VLAGLTVGYVASGRAFLNHWLVRLLLARTGLAPARYVAFLNFAATRILLHKVGSGYIFYHRLLLEYFARLELEEVPERYRRGALSAVDLRPEKLLEQALARTPNDPGGALQALRYAADQLQPEQFAPTALKVAKSLEESLETQRQRRFVGTSFEIYALIEAAKGAYLLVADSGHPDLAPTAAFYCGELLTRSALIDEAGMHLAGPQLSSYKDGWKREARAAYRRAVQSQHPIHAGIAASRLVKLDADQGPRPGTSSAPAAAPHRDG
jgi:hypothetical protein